MVRKEAIKSWRRRSVPVGSMRLGIGEAPHKDDSPWQLVVLVKKEIHEIASDGRHNGSGDELAQSKQMKGERSVGRRVAGYLDASHLVEWKKHGK